MIGGIILVVGWTVGLVGSLFLLFMVLAIIAHFSGYSDE